MAGLTGAHGGRHCGHAPQCIGVGEPDDRDPFGCCNCGTRNAEKHRDAQRQAYDRLRAREVLGKPQDKEEGRTC